jgi:hypothetical protein
LKSEDAVMVGVAIIGLLVCAYALADAVSRRESFDAKVLDWQLVIVGVCIAAVALVLRTRWFYPTEQIA